MRDGYRNIVAENGDMSILEATLILILMLQHVPCSRLIRSLSGSL